MDEVADLGEAFDLRQTRCRLRFRETKQRRVHVNILDAGELKIEARAEFQQRGDATRHLYVAVRRVKRARDDLQAAWTCRCRSAR